MISLASAETAGQLAAEIAVVTQRLAWVSQAITDACFLNGGQMNIVDPSIDPSTGVSNTTVYPVDALTPAESATIFTAMQTILTNRLSGLNQQLAAITS